MDDEVVDLLQDIKNLLENIYSTVAIISGHTESIKNQD